MVARINAQLARLDVQELMDLRKKIDAALAGMRATLEKQLAALGMDGGSVGNGVRGKTARRGRGSAMKGKKVAAKYRGPGGETWAGRGATPRWLVAAIKGGKEREDFLIDKSAATGRKKRKSKR